MEPVYLDHNATTQPLPEVAAAMGLFLTGRFGNPSSLHSSGAAAKAALEQARAQVARLLGASPAEIVFTSGGTEADNLALYGAALPGTHVITSAIEHPAVLRTLEFYRALGVKVTVVRVGEGGRIDPEEVRAALRPETRLVSIMTANNETGVAQPVEQLARIAAEAGALFHTDAVQAAGKLPLDVRALGCDLLSISSHKMHGPPGMGALYVRAGTVLRPLLHGGGQERGRRAGTENLAGAVGFGVAAQRAVEWLEAGEAQGLAALRDRLELALLSSIPGVHLNGARSPRVPNTTNLSFDGIAGRALAAALDDEGICVSTGSACAAGSPEPPHALLAMGVGAARAHGAIRFSLGRHTTAQEIDRALEAVPRKVQWLRTLSPRWRPEAG